MKIYNIINIPKGLSQEIECDCREEYNSGYTAGLEEGYDKGYDSGYTDGAESVDCTDFYNSGVTDGYASGYTDGLNACSGGNEDLIANIQGDYFVIPEGTNRIRPYAFYIYTGVPREAISSIAIPSSVIEIGQHAFYNWQLTGITIPSSVQIIGDYVFANAFSKTMQGEVNIPNSVESIGNQAFALNPYITAATLSSKLIEIPIGMFRNCSLTGITLPRGVAKIDADAFKNNPFTTNIDIPPSVNIIEASAFDGCSGLTSMTFESTEPCIIDTRERYESLGSSAYTWPIYVPCEAVDTYKTAWPYYAHRIMCSGTPLSVSGDITNKFVYSGDSAQTVQLSSSGFLDFVTSMYVNGEQITPVSAITMEPGMTYYIDYYTNTDYNYVPSYVSFDGTDVVEAEVRGAHITQLQGCYGNCKRLTAATLSSAITEVFATFENCENLASVNVGNSTMIVRDVSFKNCSSLTGITLSPSLIGANAFAGSGLRSFSIGGNCTSIGSAAFSNCTALTEVVINGRSFALNSSVGASTFSGCSALSSVTFVEFTRRITNAMFKNCTALTAITLPSNNLGTESFYNTGLRSITVPEGATSIGNNAFYNCQYLNSVVLPSTITNIGNAAFAGTNLLTAVTIYAKTPPSLATSSGANASLGYPGVPIYVPASAVETYKNHSDYVIYKDYIQAIQ